MPEPTTSGIDMARAAFAAARLAAKQRPTGPARKKPAAGTALRRGSGRDPITTMQAVKEMLIARGYEIPVAGGTVIDQWASIAPDLAGQTAAEAFDSDTGTLSVRPATAAYGTQLRLSERAVIARINTHMGRLLVKSLRILPPRPTGSGGTATGGSGAGDDRPQTAAVDGPRREAPGAYLEAKATAQAATGPVDPLAAAVHRAADAQTAALLRSRQPREQFTDAVAIQEDVAARAAAAEDVRLRALARKRLEQAGHAPAVPRVFGQTA